MYTNYIGKQDFVLHATLEFQQCETFTPRHKSLSLFKIDYPTLQSSQAY